MPKYLLTVWLVLVGAALCQDTGIVSGLTDRLTIGKPSPVYILHWKSQEKCHECNYREAVMCFGSPPDCGIPMKTVDHFEVAITKEDAVKIANEVSQEKLTSSVWDGSSGYWGTMIGGTGPPLVPRPKGTLVAIYEAKPLPIKVATKDIEIPQPPKIEKRTIISLPESR